jgi:SynChlorMet cassette protein ScmC
MLSCKFNLPGVFGWKIKGTGKCAELVRELKQIMQLPEISGDPVEMTVIPQSDYDSGSGPAQVFYRRKGVRIFHDGNLRNWLMTVPENILDDYKVRIVLMWLMLKPFYLHCLANGALPVHAASASLRGKGIIIAAAGDTGKTTTVRRLPEPWHELSDDTCLILPHNGQYHLHPLPTWSEFIHGRNKAASWKIESGAELKAIFYLKRAAQDRTESLMPPQSVMALYKSAAEALGSLEKDMPKELRKKTFESAGDVSSRTPSFHLYASLKGQVEKSIEGVFA